jgi:DNA-binding response OmpR family regulator
VPNVLLVEDDAAIRTAVTRALAGAGHQVTAVGTALDALRDIPASRPDVVLLDLGLPDMDGGDALVMVRAVSDVPIIVVTARQGERDVIRLLNAGADDYLTKPFSADHLLARIGAVLRRSAGGDTNGAAARVTVGPLHLQRDTREASLDGAPLRLTRKEFDLLSFLADRVGRVVTREELYVGVWRQPFIRADQTLDAHISLLRRKLGETAARPRLLRTVRGVGVMMAPPS